MLDTQRFQSLYKLPLPLLTAYVRIRPDDASKHSPVPSCVTWLKKEANSIARKLSPNECGLFREQLNRVTDFLQDRNSHEKSLVIFAGPNAWETVPLDVEVGDELHWGKPAVPQLLWLAAEHRHYCVVVVDRSGARFFAYRLGKISPLQETKFDVDISQWKKKDLGHVARPSIRKTHGSQREVFDHRMDAQYKRLIREAADQAIDLCRKKQYSAVFLAGPERLIAPMATYLPAELHRRVTLIHKDLGKLESQGILQHVEPEIEKWEREHELALVNELLGSERGAILGIDETLAQLQKQRIRTLVLSRDLDARLRRCANCGWTDSSADPVCPVCRGERSLVALRDVLPDLAAASEAAIEVVNGEAAQKLKEAGGMGAWLRQPKVNQPKAAKART
jgi:hypothetical protein